MCVALGPQIGYTTVFFWEYFGPLVTYAMFYFFPHVFYPSYKCACLASCVDRALAYRAPHDVQLLFCM